MKKPILKVLAIVGSIESVGCFLVEEPAMLELTNMYIKEQDDK